MSRARGFTILELMVGLAMAAVLLAVIMGVIEQANNVGRQARVRAELGNEGTLTAELLRRELGQAGLGVPSGKNITTGADNFYASVLVASATEVGVLADLARPDSNYNTFGLLDDRPAASGADHHVSWHTENNGACMPANGATCTTDITSQFFPGEVGCATTAQAMVPDRTCPWGLNRLRGGEPFQVVAGNRDWFSATNKNPLEVHDHGLGGLLVIHTGNSFPAAWPNDAKGTLPAGTAGQGWVTTLDRVFYRYIAATKRLERIQCWGAPAVADVSWPIATATTAGATPCAAPFQGMAAWELVASDVDSVAFTYLDSAGATIAQPINTAVKKKSIRMIEFVIGLKKTAGRMTIRHDIVGTTFLSMAL